MKRTLIALLAAAALTLPAATQAAQRQNPANPNGINRDQATTQGIRGNRQIKNMGTDKDFDRRRGAENWDLGRRFSFEKGRHYRGYFGPRTARNRNAGNRVQPGTLH